MPLIDFIRNLDSVGLWLGAVAAGLTALGWFLRKTWRGVKRATAFWRDVAKPLALKAQIVLDIAEYELQHNGGGSIKDSVSKIAGIEQDVAALKEGDKVLREGAHLIAERAADMRAALAEHVLQAESIHEEQGAAIAHLAEALPIIARSTPHADDQTDPQGEPHGDAH